MAEQDGLSLLVVDDKKGIGKALEDILGFNGFRIYLASDGKEGLDYLIDNPYTQALITDVNMPQMNGDAFLREAINHRKEKNRESKNCPFYLPTLVGSAIGSSQYNEALDYAVQLYSPEHIKSLENSWVMPDSNQPFNIRQFAALTKPYKLDAILSRLNAIALNYQ